MTRLVVAILLAITPLVVSADAPATHQIKLDGQTFTLPVGLTIERVAGSPLVDRPIVASFDDRGRLYVADSSGSNEKPAEQLKNPTHRIIRLEDTKGTGVFDKATVFADKMMFPEGILWHRGSVYVGAPPHIWKLTDTDDDGVADKREIWFDGKTVTGCANDLHGPYLGPDGWIYWCKGAFAKQEYTLPNGKKFTTRASHIFRARPDGTGIEPVMTGGMDNPVGMAFLPNGERFFSCTFLQHPAAGKRDGIIHAIYGGIWGKDHDVIYDSDHKWTSPTTMPVMTHLGPAAPCGMCCYQSDSFGKEFTTNLFVCQFNLRKVSRHVLKPSGSTYTTEDSDFVVSDSQDFHPTDVQEDADGSLLVVNTGGWYKLCCPSSQLVKTDVLGAIYRVRRTDHWRAKVEDPRGNKFDWKEDDLNQIIFRLTDTFRGNTWAENRRATDALVALGDKALGEQMKLKNGRKSWRGGIGSWILHDPNAERVQNWTGGINVANQIDSSKARAYVREALETLKYTWMDEDGPAVRQAAIHSISLWRDKEAIPFLVEFLKDKNLVTRRMAAEALGRIGDKAVVPALLKALEAKDVDRTLEHALTYALIEIGDAAGTEAGLLSKSTSVRQASLIALDQFGGKLKADPVLATLESVDPKVRQIARWIIGRHLEWSDEVAKLVRKGLNFETVPLVVRFLKNPAVENELLEIISVKGKAKFYEDQITALQVLEKSGVKEIPLTWVTAMERALRQGSLEVNGQVIATLQGLPPVKAPREDLEHSLRIMMRSKGSNSEFRLATMSVYPGGMRDMLADEFSLILNNLDRENSAQNRGLASTVLSKAKLTPEQLNDVIAALPKVSPLELDRVLTAFAQTKDDAIGLKLVAALSAPELRSSLRADGVKERIKHFGPAVQKEAEKLYVALNADYEQQRAKLDETVKTLKVGDIRRGQAVFNSTKTSCIACHTIGYVGGKIGPDLTRIGSLRNERDLLESILFPSASFVRSYEPLTVRTKDGKVFNGIPKKDAPDEIVLILAADKEQRIAREDIEEVQPGKVSIMPAGLDKQLTPQELADLVTFLRGCK
jgi:putative membrane-bound dehydrogenase-like protein